MARRIFSFLAILIFSLSTACHNSIQGEKQHTNRNQQPAGYQQLVEIALQQPNQVDYQKMRQLYSQQPYFHSQNPPEFLNKARKLIQQKRYQSATEIIQNSLKKYFAEIELHYLASIAYRKLGTRGAANSHSYIMSLLIDSILQQGSGQSITRAFPIISNREEDVILNFYELENASEIIIQKQNLFYHKIQVQATQRYPYSQIIFLLPIKD